MQWSRTREIVRKEFLQVFREPRMRFVLMVPPLVQTIVFGFAVNLDVDRATLAWLDRDRSAARRELYHAFTASTYFAVTAAPETDDELTGLLDRGEVMAAVTVLPGFVATRMTEGMDLPGPLLAQPGEVAEAIFQAVRRRRDVVYVRPVWRLVMAIIRALPERVFKRTRL